MNNIDTAIILAGGQGTRISEKYPNLPKALIEINGETVLERQLKQLKDVGIENVIIAVCHLADEIDNFINQNDFGDIHVYTMREREPLGTGGSIKNTMLNTQTDISLVINGDTLNDFNLNDIIKTHFKYNHENTIALIEKENNNDYGNVKVSNGFVTNFTEKTTSENDYTNAGVYILNIDSFNHTHKNTFSLEKELLPLMARNELGVHIYEQGHIWDIGTPERLEIAKKEIK